MIELDETTKRVSNCYPARVTFRGFEEQVQTEEHIKLADYLAKTANEFPEEANS